MASNGKAVVCICVGLLLWIAQASPQEVSTGAVTPEQMQVRKALQELKGAPPYERSKKVDDIVKLGEVAVSELIKEIAASRQEPDPDNVNYVGNCIIPLGRLAKPNAPEASELLIKTMSSSSSQLRYLAAAALGDIWQKAPNGEMLQKVNGALLASVYEAANPGEIYGPSLALATVNDVKSDKSVYELQAEELKNLVLGWAAQNPDRLPPISEQPWPMLLGRVTTPASEQELRQAKELLVRNKPLYAVEAIVESLRKPETEAPDKLWRNLGDVLTGITGESFPGNLTSGTRSEQVDSWLARWSERLKGRKEQPYREYGWARFERALRELSLNPTPEAQKPAEMFRDVVLHQLDSRADVPPDASKRARELVADLLEAKQLFRQAVDALKSAQQPFQKLDQVRSMRSSLQNPRRREIAGQFIPELAEFARQERNKSVLEGLASLLTDMAAVRIELSTSDNDRNKAIDTWLRIVSSQRSSSEGPK